jgi:Flp pilus assembly protein TadG
MSKRGPTPRHGGSVLEMVLTLTLLLNLTFGAIEFGYYFFVKNMMQGAAREGVRAAIVAGATDTSVTTMADSVLSAAGLTTSQYTIHISPDLSTSPSAGTSMTVTITATWGTVGNGFRPLGIIGTGKTLTAAVVMRKEG